MSVTTNPMVTGVPGAIMDPALFVLSAAIVLPKTSSLVTDPFFDPTPTQFFDPTATGGTGAGTLANPFYTLAQVTTFLNSLGTAPGSQIILGFKRGTMFRGQFSATLNFSGSQDFPVILCAYGDAAAAPIIDGKTVRTDWVQTSAGSGLWYRPYTLEAEPYQSQQRLYKVYNAADASLANILATLSAAGPGHSYCVLQTTISGVAQYTLYIYPLNGENPNLGQVECADLPSPYMYVHNFVEAANKGNLWFSGLYFRGSRGDHIKIFMPSGAGSSTIAQARNLSFTNCIFGQVGASVLNGGGASTASLFCGVTVDGGNDSVRATQILFGGNYGYDLQHNLFEFSACQNVDVLWNESDQVVRMGVCESYGSCDHIKIRYNKSRGYRTMPFAASSFAQTGGIFIPGWAYGTTGVLDYTQNTLPNNQTHDVEIAFNDIQAYGTAIESEYAINLTLFNNTLEGGFNPTGGEAARIAFGTWGTTPVVANPTLSGNVYIGHEPSTTYLLMSVGASAPNPCEVNYQGDYNVYFNPATPNAMHVDLPDVATGATLGYALLSSWTAGQTAPATRDVNSVFGNPGIDGTHRVSNLRPAHMDMSYLPTGYTLDCAGKPIAAPFVGAYQR